MKYSANFVVEGINPEGMSELKYTEIYEVFTTSYESHVLLDAQFTNFKTSTLSSLYKQDIKLHKLFENLIGNVYIKAAFIYLITTGISCNVEKQKRFKYFINYIVKKLELSEDDSSTLHLYLSNIWFIPRTLPKSS